MKGVITFVGLFIILTPIALALDFGMTEGIIQSCGQLMVALAVSHE